MQVVDYLRIYISRSALVGFLEGKFHDGFEYCRTRN